MAALEAHERPARVGAAEIHHERLGPVGVIGVERAEAGRDELRFAESSAAGACAAAVRDGVFVAGRLMRVRRRCRIATT